MYRPAPRPLMLVSPPGVAASYRRGVSLSRGFSILEAEAPMPRVQRGSDGGSLQGAASHIGQCDVTAGEVAIGEAHPRAAEAAVICLLDMEARLERHALERCANCLAPDPECVRRQRYRALRSRA